MLVTQLYPTLHDPWTADFQVPLSIDSPSKNNGVDSHSLLQGIFLTQGWNPGIWPYRQILYCMSHEDSPTIMSIHWRFCILNVPYRILLCNAMVVSLVQLHHPVMSDFCNPMDCSMPGFLSITNSQSLLRLMSIELVMPSNHLILCHPLLLLPSIFPSIRGFSNESVLPIRWPKYCRFSFNISPPVNIQDWFPLGWTGWISMQSKRLSRVLSNTTV